MALPFGRPRPGVTVKAFMFYTYIDGCFLRTVDGPVLCPQMCGVLNLLSTLDWGLRRTHQPSSAGPSNHVSRCVVHFAPLPHLSFRTPDSRSGTLLPGRTRSISRAPRRPLTDSLPHRRRVAPTKLPRRLPFRGRKGGGHHGMRRHFLELKSQTSFT